MRAVGILPSRYLIIIYQAGVERRGAVQRPRAQASAAQAWQRHFSSGGDGHTRARRAHIAYTPCQPHASQPCMRNAERPQLHAGVQGLCHDHASHHARLLSQSSQRPSPAIRSHRRYPPCHIIVRRRMMWRNVITVVVMMQRRTRMMTTRMMRRRRRPRRMEIIMISTPC